MSEMIEISAEQFDEMTRKIFFLECLEAVGVDYWEGYSEAASMSQVDDEY